MMVARAGTSQAKTAQFTTNAFWQVKKNRMLEQHTFLLINYRDKCIHCYVFQHCSAISSRFNAAPCLHAHMIIQPQ